MNGYLRMLSHAGINPVEYKFTLAKYKNLEDKKLKHYEYDEIHSEYNLNSLLDKKIKLTFNEEIRCVDCGRLTKKSFNQGSCYSCFLNLASNDMCILKPETCHYHSGTCREPGWGKENCFKKHTLYLANTSGVKVGITKENPITKRWVDQGAMFAIPVMEFENRRDSGLMEIEFGKFITDKTSWQGMISKDSDEKDLFKIRDSLLEKVNPEKLNIPFKMIENPEQIKIDYPIKSYPKKKVTLKPDKLHPIEDTLIGVKGQYLLFKNGVINIRSYGGYYVTIDV